VSSPFTTARAVASRIRELGTTPDELADKAGVPRGTVKYFGLLSHDQQTLERLSVALDWPPCHLRELWETPPARPQNPRGHPRPNPNGPSPLTPQGRRSGAPAGGAAKNI
jgi:hypothetical protein